MNRICIIVLSSVMICCSPQKTEETYFPNGKLRSQVTMKNGKRNGMLREYYADGKLHSEVPLVDDLSSGEGVIYYPDGTVARKSNFVDGILVGEDRGYFSNGKLKFTSVYDSSGNLIDFVAFNQNGERDFNQLKPVAYFERRRDGSILLHARLANADPTRYQQGILVITTSFQENGMASDTLYSERSHNLEGFKYIIPKENAGDTVRGFLIFSFPSDTAITQDIFSFKYKISH